MAFGIWHFHFCGGCGSSSHDGCDDGDGGGSGLGHGNCVLVYCIGCVNDGGGGGNDDDDDDVIESGWRW